MNGIAMRDHRPHHFIVHHRATLSWLTIMALVEGVVLARGGL